MPYFFAVLVGSLISSLGTFVGRILVSLGIGFITYTGFDVGLTWMKAQIVAQVGSLGTQALAVLGAAQVGSAVNIVISAMAIRMFIDGVTSGSVRKMVQKAGV